METARGRWFLREFAQRNRSADTLTILDAIGRIQGALAVTAKAPAEITAEIVSLAQIIASTRSDIVSIRNDIFRDADADTDERSVYAMIAEHAKSSADEIMVGTQRLQKLATDMKAANANEAEVAEVQDTAHSLRTLAWSQDLLSQRLAKAMELLLDLDVRIAAMAGSSAQPVDRHLEQFRDSEGPYARAKAEDASAAPPLMNSPESPESASTLVVYAPVEASTMEVFSETAMAALGSITPVYEAKAESLPKASAEPYLSRNLPLHI